MELNVWAWIWGFLPTQNFHRAPGKLQRLIRSAERVIGCPLPSLEALFTSRTVGRARKIMADPTHPGHRLFAMLPSGRRLRSLKADTARHVNSFFPTAIRLLNSLGFPPWSPSTLLHPHLRVLWTQCSVLWADLNHYIIFLHFIFVCFLCCWYALSCLLSKLHSIIAKANS